VISIPAQAPDCATVCENAARGAAFDAYMKAQSAEYDDCNRRYQPNYNMSQWMNYCMGTHTSDMSTAYNTTYQQVLAQCNGSCH
jgi:hypothetical protein